MFGHDLFLGIDLGTTGVKAALIDEEGTPVGQLSREYTVYQPHPNWAEQSAQDWWEATAAAVRALVSDDGVKGCRVRGISVSSQAPTCLGIDVRGIPTGRALIWMDRRSQDVCDEVLQPLAQEIRNTCGNRVDPYYFLPKYLWLRKNIPEQERSAACFLQANGWIVYCMTHEMSIDTTHLTHLQVYDVFHDRWNTKLMEKLDIDRNKLPRIYRPQEIVGELTEKAAGELKLPVGIPVVAGCTDAAAAALGLGHDEVGGLFEMSGQSSGIGLVMDRPRINTRLNLSRGAMENRWNQKGSMSATGGALRWYRDKIDRYIGENAYTVYDAMAAQSPAGARGVIFLPYLTGERAPLWDSSACGIFFGLRLMAEKQDLLRAILEGAAYGLRTIRDTFDPKLMTSEYLLGTGGGYKSNLWAQIKADVLKMPIQVQRSDFDAACMGDAFLAMCANGLQPPWNREKRIEKVYIPNPGVGELYDEGYRIFCSLYKKNRELMKDDLAFAER